MIPRLHFDAPLKEGARLALGEAQAHYVRNVLRRGVGEPLKIFNARDGEFAAALAVVDKKRVEALLAARLRAPAPDGDLWLLFAPVKRDVVDLIVEKATELGVSRILPVETERTQAHRMNEQRLAAISTEAAEQCGRLSVPKIEPLQALSDLIERWPQDRRLIYCDEAGDDPNAEWGGETGRAPPILDAAKSLAAPVAVLVGPEGGFSPQERARLRAQPFVSAVSLGPRILRADTAAIAALAIVQAASGDWR